MFFASLQTLRLFCFVVWRWVAPTLCKAEKICDSENKDLGSIIKAASQLGAVLYALGDVKLSIDGRIEPMEFPPPSMHKAFGDLVMMLQKYAPMRRQPTRFFVLERKARRGGLCSMTFWTVCAARAGTQTHTRTMASRPA